MNSILNGILRELIRFFFFLLGKFIHVANRSERKKLPENWAKLKSDLLYDEIVPEGFESQRERLHKVAKFTGQEIFVAKTSGTRNTPKTIPYTITRLKDTQKIFLKSMITLTAPVSGRKTFFVLSSLEEDSSLTSGLLKEKIPSHLELLQAPYRYLTTKDGQKLRDFIGIYGARLAIMIVTGPRYIYATNPSTLTHFFDELKTNWELLQSDLRRLLSHKEYLRKLLKLSEGNALQRLNHIAKMNEVPEIEVILPKLLGVITWDGGYVSPFTNRLKEKLPKHVQHFPMYSMSTETIETLPHRIDGKLYFLPSMKNAYPEFLKDGKLHSPLEVQIGEIYTLVITDRYGLLRYDTQDEFIVTNKVEGLPDIHFKRRRNVTASMTGEKISEDQCHLLFEELRKIYALNELFLSLYGVAQNGEFGYHLALIGPKASFDKIEFAHKAERILQLINDEYRGKVESGRLHPLMVNEFSVGEFAKLMGQGSQWESQFKVMPLYEKPLGRT